MAEVKVISSTGNGMVTEAFRQAAPDVVAAYPITPQTTIIEGYSKLVADGKVHTELVATESEHSALSACVGASAAGARVATATSSQGLALMWEELYIASGMRLPIVLANANRALSAPINIHGDHSDIMGARDAGWIILMAENAQEAYDNTLISFRIAEHPEVLLPVLTCLDGFITTHAMERCELIDDATVSKFVGNYEPTNALLDLENPVSHGMFANLGGSYMNFRLAQRRAFEEATPHIQAVGDEWAAISGRPFEAVEAWGMEDAEYAVVIIGSAAGNVRHVARELRATGKKVGVVRVRLYRPFPAAELAAILTGTDGKSSKNLKAVAIMDRADSLGAEQAPLALDVRSALYSAQKFIPTKNYIYGLGGADVTQDIIQNIYAELEGVAAGTIDGSIKFTDIA
jgi:pyruvate ferredoxin oxidoreductase alpha subunit